MAFFGSRAVAAVFFDGNVTLFGVAGAGGMAYLLYEAAKQEAKQEAKRHSSSGTVTIYTSGRNIPQWVKIAVAHRDEGKCRVCGSDYDLQYDHIVPYSRGGNSADVDNIQLLCGRCNRRKSNRYVG